MNQSPQDPNNIERRQELQREKEAFRLQQEARRLEAARLNPFFAWTFKTIYFLVGALEILLFLRFVLRLFGANPQNTFAEFIYGLSAPFIAPFATLFISPVSGGGVKIFDVNVLVAIVAYSLLGWLAISFVRYMAGR